MWDHSIFQYNWNAGSGGALAATLRCRKMLPEFLRPIGRKLRNSLYRVRNYDPPQELTKRMLQLTSEGRQALEKSLRSHYFSYLKYFPDPPEIYLKTDDGIADLQDHLENRLSAFRSTAIPWINSFLGGFEKKHILEIGCGTGSSTVALAEQGAIVTATDVHDSSLRCARDRIAIYHLNSQFLCSNAADLLRHFKKETFDVVALFAALEHMTLAERLKAISNSWALLKPGGYMVVLETPNRLWVHDIHTALEDFFLWLPDDLAILWSRRTKRERYNRVLSPFEPDASMTLARWGRGVSFHEFALALELNPNELPVASCKSLFYRNERNEHRAFANTWWRRYEEFLVSRSAGIHRGFFLDWLDLAFLKPNYRESRKSRCRFIARGKWRPFVRQ